MAKAKAKLPKKVAGVKVPKALRKQAKQALNLAGSPVVRELAVAGLTLAVERALEKLGSKKKATQSLDKLELAELVRAAAAEGARRFLESYEAPAAPAAKPKAPTRPKSPAKPATAPRRAAAPKPRRTPGAKPTAS